MNLIRARASTWRRAPSRTASCAKVGSAGNTSAHLDICVLGAGVIGLTTAVRLSREVPGARVTVLADRFGGDTTTSGD